jgi:hypothetical protein
MLSLTYFITDWLLKARKGFWEEDWRKVGVVCV